MNQGGSVVCPLLTDDPQQRQPDISRGRVALHWDPLVGRAVPPAPRGPRVGGLEDVCDGGGVLGRGDPTGARFFRTPPKVACAADGNRVA